MLPKIDQKLPPLDPLPRRRPKYRSVFADTIAGAWDAPLSQVAQVSGPVPPDRIGRPQARPLQWRECAWKTVAVPKGVKGPHGERHYYWNVYSDETRWEPPSMITLSSHEVVPATGATATSQDLQGQTDMQKPVATKALEEAKSKGLSQPTKAADPVVFHTGHCLGGEFFHLNVSKVGESWKEGGTLKFEALDLEDPSIKHQFSISMDGLVELMGRDQPIEAQCRWVVDRLRFSDARDLSACPRLVLEPLPIDVPRCITIEGLPHAAVGRYVLQESYLDEHEPLRLLVWEKEENPSLRLFRALEGDAAWSWGCSKGLPFNVDYTYQGGESPVIWDLPREGSWVSSKDAKDTLHVRISDAPDVTQPNTPPPLPNQLPPPPCPLEEASPLLPDYDHGSMDDPVWRRAREEEEEMLRQLESEAKAKADAEGTTKTEAEPLPTPEAETEEDRAKKADEMLKDVLQKPVQFERNKDILKPEGKKVLEEVAGVLKQFPELLVVCEGNTAGGPTENDHFRTTLSSLRSHACKKELVAKYEVKNKIFCVGHGCTKQLGTCVQFRTVVSSTPVHIKVNGATNLYKTSMFGKMDPQVMCETSPDNRTVSAVHKDAHQTPVWDYETTIDWVSGAPVQLSVWNGKDLIGMAVLDLEEDKFKAGFSGDIELLRGDGFKAKAGTVNMAIDWPQPA